MAGHQEEPRARAGGLGRGLLLAAALAVLAPASGCRLSREFRISGTITIAAHLQGRVPHANAVLFIVAKTRGGVPLAVRRIVNPQFPVSYALGPEDLLVPGTRPKEALRVEVQMNTHGNVGEPAKGDLEGAYRELVHPGQRGAHVVIDRQR